MALFCKFRFKLSVKNEIGILNSEIIAITHPYLCNELFFICCRSIKVKLYNPQVLDTDIQTLVGQKDPCSYINSCKRREGTGSTGHTSHWAGIFQFITSGSQTGRDLNVLYFKATHHCLFSMLLTRLISASSVVMIEPRWLPVQAVIGGWCS